MASEKLKVVMLPWFSFGHFIPNLHLANILAQRGHQITLLLPPKAVHHLHKHNLYPNLITLHPITIPHVEPLPPVAETTSDVPFHLQTHLATSFDRTRPEIESILTALSPNLVFYDHAHWVPKLAPGLGIKFVVFHVVCASVMAYCSVPGRHPDSIVAPPGYPSATVLAEPWRLRQQWEPFGETVSCFYERICCSLSNSDAILYRSCREFEGKYCNYIAKRYNKPVLLCGPALPDDEAKELEPRWAEWLGRFGLGSVVFCSLGSQFVLIKAQFKEVLLGFEMTKLPFLLALRSPEGCATVEEAFPEGFKERVEERGVVYGGWVPQPELLKHPSVGCFVNHCGPGTMWEALLSEKQMVFMPQFRDHAFSAKIMAGELKVGVEVETEEEGWVSKESVCTAIKSVMDEKSEIAGLVKKNHEIWRDKLLSPGFKSGYIDSFIKDLNDLVG